MKAPISLIGLPTDINSSHIRGPAKAPAQIRRVLHSGMSNYFSESGIDLSDTALLKDNGDLALEENGGDFERIAEASKQAFQSGSALFLGGDHFVTWPIVEGLIRANGSAPNIVHIDAHPDLYPDFEANPSSHASPFARLLEADRIKSLTQIGIRTVNKIQKAQIEKYRVSVFSPREIDDALRNLPTGPTYVSIDIDGLDPAFAPGVSHHEPGGLTVREVLNVIDALPGPVIGADIVEYNPDRDINDMTAAVCVKLFKEVAARIALDIEATGAKHAP